MVTLASIVEKETGKADERPRSPASSSTGCASTCGCNRTRPSSMAWSAARAPGPSADPRRRRIGEPLQHLCHRRPAARPDRQSRPRRAGGGRQSARARRSSISSPTGPAATSSPIRSKAHNRNVQQLARRSNRPGPSRRARDGRAEPRDDHTELAPPFGAAAGRRRVLARHDAYSAPRTARLGARPGDDRAHCAAISRCAAGAARGDRPRPVPPRVAVGRDRRRHGQRRLGGFADRRPPRAGKTTSTAPPPMSRSGGPGGGRRLEARTGPADALAYSGAPVNAAPNGRPRIFDASQGTALDPLRDKSWDLNSPKTVDPERAQGPPAPTLGN